MTNWQAPYHQWQNYANLDQSLQTELTTLTKQTDQSELIDAFYQLLPFGTAGMRGKMGVGTNRMNIYTVQLATAGLALLMSELGEATKKRGVVISYDSRFNSQKFAKRCAETLGATGIKVYLFDAVRPTPELSFAVRYLKAYAGIMITASHNPKEDNGYKLYGPDGAQLPPKEVGVITSKMSQLTDLFALPHQPLAQLKENNLLEIIGAQVDQAYLKSLQKIALQPELLKQASFKLVFTPLHGVGGFLGVEALKAIGFKQVIPVASQFQPDGAFPTVKKPNPEEALAFNEALKVGAKEQAELLVALDPDADRLGVAVLQADSSYQLLRGNEIASLMLDYLLSTKQVTSQLPKNGVIIKSLVSTELAKVIAQNYQVETIDVLTGFKYIAEKIAAFEKNNTHTFLFGFEESYGYLVEPFVRDKDALQALILITEMTAYYLKQGKTLSERLAELFAQYGYFKEKTVARTLTGVDGQAKIKALLEKFRTHPFTALANVPVVKWADYQTGLLHQDDQIIPFATESANVLKYYLADETWIAIRPSGTEPKIKFYLGVKGQSQSEAEQKLLNIEQALLTLIEE